MTTGIGTIGCGSISSAYPRTLTRAPGVRVVAAADLDPARARARHVPRRRPAARHGALMPLLGPQLYTVRRAGLALSSAHVPLADLRGDPDAVADVHLTLGTPMLVVP